jgi:hypothetical protein
VHWINSFADGLRHEQVMLAKLESQGAGIARLPGKQNEADYAVTKAAVEESPDFNHQASLCNDELRGSADLLRRIEQPSSLGPWSYIPIESKLATKQKTTFLVQASAYCELMKPLLGTRPDHFKLYRRGSPNQQQARGWWRNDLPLLPLYSPPASKDAQVLYCNRPV